MSLNILRQDITKMKCDAIVNAANSSLLGGGGVDGAIHHAAGKELLEECKTLGGCKTGESKITKGYNMNCKYIIHTVGPVWHGGNNNEKNLLTSCFRESLNLAVEYNCESIAFPLISSGIFGYPKAEAFQVAIDTCVEFLKEHDMEISIVVFDNIAHCIAKELFPEIQSLISDNYAEKILEKNNRRNKMTYYNVMHCTVSMPENAKKYFDSERIPELEKALENIDESFRDMLFRKIDEKGMTDPECYKKANFNGKMFSKIRNDPDYHPKKPTAVAFAIALELSLDETKDLLLRAGYALSHSSKFDIIIEHFISNKNYNIFEINEALFAFGQDLLGSV